MISKRNKELREPLRRGSRANRPPMTIEERTAIRPATREESAPIGLAAVVLGFFALILSASRGYLLLYGDAVAHLAIARRIFDSRNPGLPQLGGVWLPLPHILMLPFVQRMDWWQNGIAGTWPSFLSYVFAAIAFYRLARRLMPVHWSFAATAFFALNANLLYLSSTAMTEPLFLALLLWSTLVTMECVEAIEKNRTGVVSRCLFFAGILSAASVYTRYDGWILAAIVWGILTWKLLQHKDLMRRVRPAFIVFTVLIIAAPLSWLAYNWRFTGDPLDFMRGPYSAAAIERRTAPPGQHYRGWHNPLWALIFYARTAQVDAAAWETGFAVMAAALIGLWTQWKRKVSLSSLLLWMPLPFYIYSIAYGSVPIFIPQLWPHSYYNARYGMELLPALAIFAFIALARLEAKLLATRPIQAVFLQPLALFLCVVNLLAMLYGVFIPEFTDPSKDFRLTPLVMKEGVINSRTRIPFEEAVAREIRSFPAGVPILMYTSDHVGAVQQAGIPLKQLLSESDFDSFHKALADPASNAAYVVSIAGDPVSKAVDQHPEGLKELVVFCVTGQPCARFYQSERFYPASH